MDKSLLDILLNEDSWQLSDALYSCWNARGLYDPLQFALRLRPDIHRHLASTPSGIVTHKELSTEQVYAFSTYLHETIHWWQHIGTVNGLFLSLLYPAQTHCNRFHLSEILKTFGPKKSLVNLGLHGEVGGDKNDHLYKEVNIVVNNWHDIEFYKRLVILPKESLTTAQNPYFESVGHSYCIAIMSVLSLLSSTLDTDHKAFLNPEAWEPELMRLRSCQASGFSRSTNIAVPPLGAKEIFEGQARFSQLQYLYVFHGKAKTWSDFEDDHLLSGVYVEAFKTYLDVTGFDTPDELDSPIVGLFLLVCDIAMNAVEGFARDVEDLEELVNTHDPGIRFLRLCHAIKNESEFFGNAIADYSPDEYWSVSTALCRLAGLSSPMDLLGDIETWVSTVPALSDLLLQDRDFHFEESNLPVRLFCARFLKMQLDKKEHPVLFCWPGICMSKSRRSDVSLTDSLALFEEHSALFIDKEDGDVYPRLIAGRDEAEIDRVFNTFFSFVATYELSRQWIMEPGEFICEFSWLTTKYNHDEIRDWAAGLFEKAYGVPFEQFGFVAAPSEEAIRLAQKPALGE